ncbi:MAG: hypothetical protein J7521_07205 [Caulobacter sp.]|nr:hypothetical protein [Caulobacter sp.]
MTVSVEAAFLTQAMNIGLVEKMTAMRQDLDRSIAEFPSRGSARYFARLHELRDGLRQPTLRSAAALVARLCEEDPSRVAQIRPAFARLVEVHPDLAWFYGQLPGAPSKMADANG